MIGLQEIIIKIEEMDNLKVIYDLQSLPNYVTIEQLHNIMVNGSYAIY